MIKDYYKALEIKHSSSSEDIKNAFRKLAIFWHPDKNSSQIALIKMQEINEAYQILSDPIKKELYDKIYLEYLLEKNKINIKKYDSVVCQKNSATEKYKDEIIKLNQWIKNIKFSIRSFDKFLDQSLTKIDKPIENFVYYFPIILFFIVIIFILFTKVNS